MKIDGHRRVFFLPIGAWIWQHRIMNVSAIYENDIHVKATQEVAPQAAPDRRPDERAATETVPADSQQELHQVLAALGDPVRLTIVRQLAERGEVPCGGFQFDLAKSTLSHHFKVLRESGVVASRPEGTSLMNCLNRAELERRFPGLLDGVLQADSHARGART
jgi:DNA-binding transcriptional ArsR family regulator